MWYPGNGAGLFPIRVRKLRRGYDRLAEHHRGRRRRYRGRCDRDSCRCFGFTGNDVFHRAHRNRGFLESFHVFENQREIGGVQRRKNKGKCLRQRSDGERLRDDSQRDPGGSDHAVHQYGIGHQHGFRLWNRRSPLPLRQRGVGAESAFR